MKSVLLLRHVTWLVATLFVVACGGGADALPVGGNNPPPMNRPPTAYWDVPQTDAEAARFLTQATFGPARTEIARLRRIGYARWIDEQLDPARTPITLVLPYIEKQAASGAITYAERRNYWLWQATSAPD